MITLYNKTETAFTHNGLGILDNEIIAPKVHEELNGLFSLSFDYPIQSKLAQQLVPEMIVKAPVPNMSNQLFRITERGNALDGLIHIVAHHIFYDLAKNFIEDTYVVNKNGSQALNQILGATQFTHRFTGTSNISHVDNARLVRLNPAEVLLDSDLDNGFLARWGGEIIRDNFSISMLTARGTNNGVQIRDKKNLTGYTSDLVYSGIVTRIMPEGYDGLFLPEKYVDSPRINQYVAPKIKVIKYDSVKVGDKEGELTQAQAYARLRELAQLEYSQHNVDAPIATYEVTFAPLEKTEEYKNFSQLETINIGDTVTVIHEEDKLNIAARMIAYEYNPLMQTYISVTLGNLMPKFTDIAKDIKHVDTKVTRAKDDANVALTAANGKNTNFYGTVTPSNPKLGDVWYKENGDKLEMWVYETREGVTQWFPLMTDLTQEEVKQAVEQAQAETAQALESANSAYEAASEALENATSAVSQVATLETSVVQNSNAFTVMASGVSNLEGRMTTAETTLTVQAGQIASKVNQSTIDALTSRVTTAETAITQNADSFQLSLSKTQKAVNDTIGASILQSEWQTGTISTINGSEAVNSAYVRSGYFEVTEGKKYLLQTYEGQPLPSSYGTVYLFYYQANKTFIGYAMFSNSIPFTVIANAAYLRIRITSTANPSTINCYLLPTDVSDGYVNLSTVSNIVKLTATSQAVQLKVEETSNLIGIPFKVKAWQQGSLSTTDGSEMASTTFLRSEVMEVKTGEKYIGQLPDGTAVTFYYHFYGMNVAYVDYVPAAKQYVETITAGTYTNGTIAGYLLSKDVENLNISATPTGNPYTSSGDYLAIYKLPLSGKTAPQVLSWTGRKDTSDNSVWLFTNGSWTQIATITSANQATYEWTLTDEQKAGITSDSVYLAFFSIKNGAYAGLYNNGTTPFLMNPSSDSLLYQISTLSSSSVITIPANVLKMRVRVNTTTKPDDYDGNVFSATVRADYTKAHTVYSAILMQKDIINLRVGKGDVINQINLSPESILISGNKVHITGQTTIDNAVITSAMIKDLSITNAQIADATIGSAKIASLDAGKITTGTLNASRIAANSITADKLAANILTAITASSSIRITGTTIGYYSGSTLVTEINSQGMTIRRDGTTVGTIGANNISGHNDWRGLVFDLEYGTEYMSWAHQDSSSASAYTQKLTWYASKLQNGMDKGFHFSDIVYFDDKIGVSYSDGTTRHVRLTTTTISSVYETIQSGGGTAGIVFAGNNLYLCDDGVYVDFGIIREICKKLAGKTIVLPSAINSSGQITSWYSAQTFNSWTQYS